MRRLRARIRRLLHLQPKTVGTITMTLVADTSRFTEAIAKVGPLLRDAESEMNYRHALKVQRLLGLAHVYGELDDWLTDLGLSWEDLR